MILFPAIDILNGKSVRLLYGEFDKVTDYGNPIDMAKKWESQNAQYLHIVDLDGAKSGDGINLYVVKEIVKNVKIPVQLGGGIRTLEDIKIRLEDVGVDRVILGTICYSNPDLVLEAIKRYSSERIVCGIDAKNGSVAIKGWAESTNLPPEELGKRMYDGGVRYVVYTDISRDGALGGVNVEACKKMSVNTGLKCVASGGVKDIDDLIALKKANIYGAIMGKAIYSGKFSVSDALDALKEF